MHALTWETCAPDIYLSLASPRATFKGAHGKMQVARLRVTFESMGIPSGRQPLQESAGMDSFCCTVGKAREMTNNRNRNTLYKWAM